MDLLCLRSPLLMSISRASTPVAGRSLSTGFSPTKDEISGVPEGSRVFRPEFASESRPADLSDEDSWLSPGGLEHDAITRKAPNNKAANGLITYFIALCLLSTSPTITRSRISITCAWPWGLANSQLIDRLHIHYPLPCLGQRGFRLAGPHVHSLFTTHSCFARNAFHALVRYTFPPQVTNSSTLCVK